MIAYPDTSFLCGLYVPQDNSLAATQHAAAMPERLHVASPLLYEFRQSVRFQAYLHSKDPTKGYDRATADTALAKLRANIHIGGVVMVPVDWSETVNLAEQLSAKYTWTLGYRGFDILHVATALHLGAREFLTFDARQKALAKAEGLLVPL